jgi:hypothetical protein
VSNGHGRIRLDCKAGIAGYSLILRGEDIMQQVGIPYELPLRKFRKLLGALHDRDQHIIIECESRETEVDDRFLI